MPEASLYERVGGMPYFERLVDRFYEGIRQDPVVGPMYEADPGDPDLSGPRRRLTLFLVQYWGGPTTYLAERGHPRLRSRHFPFPIGAAARDHWLLHMRAAIDASGAAEAERAELNEYMTQAAEAMRNIGEAAADG